MSGGDILIVSLGVVGSLLLAVPYLNADYRLVCDKFVGPSPVLCVLLLSIIGFTMGMAFGCLVAPRRFLEGRGQHWLYIWKAATLGRMRMRCLIAILLVGLLTANLWALVLHR